MNSVVVTGANGFIGRNLIRYLVDHGISVCAVVRPGNDSHIKDISGVTIIEAHLNEMHQLAELIGSECSPDVFYHFAWDGTNGVLRTDYSRQLDNVKFTCDAAFTSKRLGCRRFISLGTITELVVPYAVEHQLASQSMTYAISKVTASQLLEYVCKSEAIDYIWVRLSNIFGGDNTNGNLISYTIEEFKKGNTPTFGPALQPYNFTYIDDVVEALYLMGEHTGEHKSIYMLSNGEHRILRDYLTEVAEVYNRSIELGVRPDDGIRYDDRWFDDNSLQRDFGYEPKHMFSDAIRHIFKTHCL